MIDTIRIFYVKNILKFLKPLLIGQESRIKRYNTHFDNNILSKYTYLV